jgi:hypothetical protein
MTPTITTFRPWHRRLVDAALDRLLRPAPAHAEWRGLDARSLADIGVDASEIDSIDAESRDPRAGITRRRIVLA